MYQKSLLVVSDFVFCGLGKFFHILETYYFVYTGAPNILAKGSFPSVLWMGKGSAALWSAQADQCLFSNP